MELCTPEFHILAPSRLQLRQWNFTNSVDRGIYKRIEERDVELRIFFDEPVYISFCLSASYKRASFYERYCSPDNPSKTRILKRIVGKQTNMKTGWLVRGDTEGSLDSRVLGPIQDIQVSGFWRPYFIWSTSGEN